jgi:hypothetical protein
MIRAMIDGTHDAEVPGAGLGADDDGAGDDGGAGLNDGAAGDNGGAGLGADDDGGEELIEVQRARFARLLEELAGEGFDGAEHQARMEAAGTWPGAEEGARQDLLLDGSAVSALAADRELLAVYLRILKRMNGALLIPLVAMTDAYTCGPDERALVDRFIEEISVDGDVFLHLTFEEARRAGELQFEMLAAAEASET